MAELFIHNLLTTDEGCLYFMKRVGRLENITCRICVILARTLVAMKHVVMLLVFQM